MKQKLIAISIIIAIFLAYTMNTCLAVSQSDVDSLKSQKESANKELKEIQSQKSTAMDEVATITGQIQTLQDEITALQDKIDNLTYSINDKQLEIEEKEAEIKEKEELLKKRLVSMYINGKSSYLDILLGSGNYIEMLMNYDAVEEITNADTKLINQIVEKKQTIQAEKEQLESEKNEVNETKTEKDSKNAELLAIKQKKDETVEKLTADEKEKQSVIDKFNAAIQSGEAEIRAAAEAARRSSGGGHANTGSIDNSSGSLGWPLDTYTARYSYITSYFGRRAQPTAGASTNHGAIDIGVSYQPVYAAESGSILTAQYVSGYGNFIMIWHQDRGELYTCYGHLSEFRVSAGMTVSRGQQIAVSGNTGISTGPHLHFEVRVGGESRGYRVDPLGYVSIS